MKNPREMMMLVVISQHCIPPDALTDVFASFLLSIMILWQLGVTEMFVALLPSVILTEQTGPMG